MDPNLSLPALVGPGLGLTGLKALFIGFPSGFTEGDPRTKLEKVLGRPPGLVGLDPNENVGLEDGDGGTLPVDKAGDGEDPMENDAGDGDEPIAMEGEGVDPREKDEGN